MKYTLKKICMASILMMAFAACKKNEADQWLRDNIDVIGKLPVIASFTVAPPQTNSVTAGSTVTLDLRYWSEEEIEQLVFRDSVGAAAKRQFLNRPYQKAYSAVSRTDSMLVPYQVPAGLAANTRIIIEAEVQNKNTLRRQSSVTLTVR